MKIYIISKEKTKEKTKKKSNLKTSNDFLRLKTRLFGLKNGRNSNKN
jgi:hypothetical protein